MEKGKRWNFIVIVSDTFRYDYVGANGNQWIRTPELDWFARQSVRFDNAYISSFPTVPHRTECFTGRVVFPHHDWQPLDPNVPVLSEILEDHGYGTQLITDTPHLMGSSNWFHRGFSGGITVPGQEGHVPLTRYNKGIEDVVPGKKERCIPVVQGNHSLLDLHMWSRDEWVWEEDRYCVKTARLASKWLELNYKKDGFFLWVDFFDVHEPWDPPEYLVAMYDKSGYDGPPMYMPNYGPASDYTAKELSNLRAHYAAECTLVSKWVGHVLKKIEELGLYENTVVIFTSDHGTYLGEHNHTGKNNMCPTDKRGTTGLYPEVAHVPMYVRVPAQQRSFRVKELVQPMDLFATILDLAGVLDKPDMNGFSLEPLLMRQRTAWLRKRLFMGSFLGGAKPGSGIRPAAADRRWWAVFPEEQDQKHELYDRSKDPSCTRNVAREHAATLKRLTKAFHRFLEEVMAEDKTQSIRYPPSEERG